MLSYKPSIGAQEGGFRAEHASWRFHIYRTGLAPQCLRILQQPLEHHRSIAAGSSEREVNIHHPIGRTNGNQENPQCNPQTSYLQEPLSSASNLRIFASTDYLQEQYPQSCQPLCSDISNHSRSAKGTPMMGKYVSGVLWGTAPDTSQGLRGRTEG